MQNINILFDGRLLLLAQIVETFQSDVPVGTLLGHVLRLRLCFVGLLCV